VSRVRLFRQLRSFITRPAFAFSLICGVPGAAAVAVIEGLALLAVLIVAAGVGTSWFVLRRKPPRAAPPPAQPDGQADPELGAFVQRFGTEWSVPGDRPWPLSVVAMLVLLSMPLAALIAGKSGQWWAGVLVMATGIGTCWLFVLRLVIRQRHGTRLRGFPP
jgi:hypothetical protein